MTVSNNSKVQQLLEKFEKKNWQLRRKDFLEQIMIGSLDTEPLVTHTPDEVKFSVCIAIGECE